ncbi:MAG: hypothetical protein RIR11_4458 [Bacteroidota bacterium]|jgi:hypothetical protein
MKQIIFFILALTLWTACKKDADTSITFVYAATHCSDKWDENTVGGDEEQYKQRIKEYLNNELNIDFTDLVILPNPDPNAVFCEACNCTNGKTIQLKSTEEFKAKLIAFGFMEQ